MKRVMFPSLVEAIELHKELIKRFGGAEGIRDLGLLESSLSRPQTGYYKSLSLQAAALMQSLALNHSFVDGNKRMAFALPAIFFAMNGYKLKVLAKEGEDFLVHGVIEKKMSIEEMATWLEKKLKKI